MKGGVVDRHRPAFGAVKLCGRMAFEIEVEPREVRAGLAVRPKGGTKRQMRQRAGESAGQLRRDDHLPGRRDLDAMRERAAGQIGVEQRHDAPDARDSEPRRHVVGAVRHEQAHGVALGETLRERPARIAVRPRGEPAIAQGFAIGQQRGRVAMGLGEIVDDGRERAGRMGGDRRRHFERAQPRLGGRRTGFTDGDAQVHD